MARAGGSALSRLQPRWRTSGTASWFYIDFKLVLALLTSGLHGLARLFSCVRGLQPPVVRKEVWQLLSPAGQAGKSDAVRSKATGRAEESRRQLPEFGGTYDRSRSASTYQSNHDICFVYGSAWKILKISFSTGKYSFVK